MVWAVAALCGLLLTPVGVATADIIPPGCTANQMNLDVTKSAFQIHNCDTVTYTVTAFNGDFPPACQMNDVTITFYPPGADGLPDMGAGVVLTTLDTFPPSRTETYPPIDVAVCVNPGVIFAQALAVYTGDLQDAPSPDPQQGSKTATVTIITSCMAVTKTATPAVSKAGDVVEYEICVSNCGSAALDNITVVDSLLGDLADSYADEFLPDDSECHTFPYTVQEGDPDPLVNEVMAEGTDVLGMAVTDMAASEVDLVHPDFTLTKECYPDPMMVGETISWDVCVDNTGDVTLMINVVDASIGLDDTVPLPPGASTCWTRSRTTTAADIPAISNEVIATATLVGVDLPNVLSRTASATCAVEGGPCIEVTKTAEPTASKAGDDVVYTIGVCNCGGLTITGITVIDSLLGDVTAAFPTDTLGPGECMTTDLTRTVLDTDPDPLFNEVTASGETATGPVADMDMVEVDLLHPHIEVTKSVDPITARVGDLVIYTICTSNTGDVDLMNITVLDSLLGDLSGFYADSLLPGESECRAFTYVVQPDDPDPLVNTVVVHANPVGLPNDISDSDSATVEVTEGPPECCFSYAPVLPTTSDVVQFTDCSTPQPPHVIVAWDWDFGDGGTSTEQHPQYSYGQEGCFEVTVTVTDSGGLSAMCSKCVHICPAVTLMIDLPVSGWYMLSSGRTQDVPIADCMVSQGGEPPIPFCDAANMWIQDPLVWYETLWQRYRSCGCLPTDEDHYVRAFQGYWLYTFVDDLTLVVP
jgi:uncharacterized repeat protein (TIGR01451 family)